MSDFQQLSLTDQSFAKRKKISRTSLTLSQIDGLVDWKRLENKLSVIDKTRTKKGGRPPLPLKWKIKMLFIQYLYNLSDPELEDQLIDRLSFQKFVGLSFNNEIPDFTTLWRFKEKLIEHKLGDAIFDTILAQLDAKGLLVKQGTIVDATIVNSTTQTMKREERESQKNNAQVDTDAEYTAKRNKYYYGYKGHIGVDKGSKIIRKRVYTPANVHDGTQLDNCLSGDEKEIYADSAYQNKPRRKALKLLGIHDGILWKSYSKGYCENYENASIRAGVEHVFGRLKTHFNYKVAAAKTLQRNALRFDMTCTLYNLMQGLLLIRRQTV